MKEVSVIKIKKMHISLNCYEEFEDRKAALNLFDLLGFKENIILQAFRMYDNWDKVLSDFEKKINCSIIKDISRSDSACIYIPHLQSNLQLFALVKSMDVQTEWNYIPNVSDIYLLLYNFKNFKNKSVVEYNLSEFESYFDNDGGLKFYFNEEYYNDHGIESIMKDWKDTLIPKK